MAPKRRGSMVGAAVPTGRHSVRRIAREPSPSSSSSSSTPVASPSTTPVDLLAGKVITTGRKVDFDLFDSEGFQIGRQIKEMGWEKICSLDIPTYPALVKEFYSNLCRGEGGLVSTVRGTRVIVTAESLGSLLEMPTIGLLDSQHEDRGGALSRLLGREVSELEEVMANQLNLELRLLHNICGRILFPKIGRFEYVSERDILLMDCIITGQPINLAGMMISYMAEAATKKRSTLPYGMVLTLVFRSQGVVIMENELQRKLRYTDYYTISTIHRMGFRKIDGQWLRKGQETRAEETRVEDIAGSSVPGPTAAGPSGPSTHSPPRPSHYSPPQGSFGVAEPAGFSDRQLEQIRQLLAERDAGLIDELKEIVKRLDSVTSTVFSSADSISVALHNIHERLGGIADGSGRYLNATNQLRRDIDAAVATIEHFFEGFKKEQKDEFMEVIGTLKRVVNRF